MQIHVFTKGRHLAYAFGRKMTMAKLRRAAEELLSEGQITAYSILEGDYDKENSVSGTCGGAAGHGKS